MIYLKREEIHELYMQEYEHERMASELIYEVRSDLIYPQWSGST